jgi:hypothetical protein
MHRWLSEQHKASATPVSLAAGPGLKRDTVNAFNRERDFWLSWAQNGNGGSITTKTPAPARGN